MAYESEGSLKRGRDVVATTAVVASVLGVGYALGTGPFEDRPALPMSAVHTAALAVLHERVPEANRTNGLQVLKDERLALFPTLSCRDGSDPVDLSKWRHRDLPTGDANKPYERVLTWKTGFTCGDREWAMEGVGEELALTTDRGLWGKDWVYKVDSFVGATASTNPETAPTLR